MSYNTEEFYHTIDKLIALNHQLRADLPINLKHGISPMEYARAYCTVHCNIGRMTGKTGYIKSRATHRDVVITAQANVSISEYPILSAWQLLQGSTHKNQLYELIYLDDPERIFKKIPQFILYEKLVNSEINQTFILLGE